MLKRRNLLVGALALLLALPLIAQDKPKDPPAKPADPPAKKDPPVKPADTPAKPKDPPTASGEKVALTWKFEKDKVFFQELTTNTEQKMKVMNQDVSQKQTQTFIFSWKALEQDKDGNWTIEQSIEGVKMSITINDQAISFDSTSATATNNPLAEFFKALVGAKFKLTVDKNMKVTKVDGRDDFIKKLGSANSQMEPLLKKILSDDALKQMADPTFGVVPAGPVGKGESWEKSSELSLGPIGTYSTKMKYTYEGKDGELHKLKVENSLTYQTPKDSETGLPFKIKSANLTSKDAGGTLHFNATKGRVEKSELTMKLEGTLDIEIGGATTKVELKQEQKTTSTTSDTSPIKK